MLPLSFLLLLAVPVRAAVSSGGPWELTRTQDGYAGRISSNTTIELTFSLGEPYLSLSSMTSGTTGIRTGYLSQIPSVSSGTTSAALPVTASTGIVLSGQIMNGIPGNGTVPLQFANEMSTTSLQSSAQLTAVTDSLGNAVSLPQTFTVSYSTVTRIYSFQPSGGTWPKGVLYQLAISTNAQDINGLPLAGATTYYFSTNRDFAAENVVPFVSDPGVKVRIPANVFPSDYFIVISSNIATAGVNTATNALKSLGQGLNVVKTVEIDPYDGLANRFTAGLNGQITLTLPFTSANGHGLVDGSNPPVPASSLDIWSLDENRNLWVRQPGSNVDIAAGQVSVTMGHFTIDALIGALSTDVGAVYAFPVPFRPNAGNTARFGSWATGITFTNLPSTGKIRIYGVSGALMREMDITTNPQVWDVKNSNGQNLASGLYIWEVTSGGSTNRKTGKLAIIE